MSDDDRRFYLEFGVDKNLPDDLGEMHRCDECEMCWFGQQTHECPEPAPLDIARWAFSGAFGPIVISQRRRGALVRALKHAGEWPPQ